MLLASLPPPVTNTLILAWLLAMGAAVGSFLNVVIYRLPAKMSLVKPGSHCPACKRPIRWRDNVPIFGWIWLRGRCRDCQAAISVRYPIVEATVAVLFVLLGVVEGLSWGANLPARPVALPDGIIHPALGVGELVGILAYHLVLLSTLLAGAVIEWDGLRVPVRLALPALIVGGLAASIWPHLHPVPAWSAAPVWMAGLVDSSAGLLAGATCGLIAEFLVLGSRDWGRVAIWGCVGLMLGWQATVVLAIVSTAVYLFLLAFIRLWPEDKGPGWLASMSVTVLLWLMIWGRVVERWPGLK